MKQFSSTVAKIKNASGEYEAIPALRGATPYEIAVRNGFEGTEEEWYNLSFDEGWVTNYQKLETNKADKKDVYTKYETISTDTRTLIGLSDDATPDEAFNKLALNNFKNLVIQKIQKSCTWTAPKALDQLFKIIVVGGGGGGAWSSTSYAGGGGGGHVTIGSITIPENTSIDIVCGAAGVSATSSTLATNGGETIFGDILTASGGECGNGIHGGAGGSGGGGAGKNGNGGNASMFGGGGAGVETSGGVFIGTPGSGGEFGGSGGKYAEVGKDGRVYDGTTIDALFRLDLPMQGSGNSGDGGYGGNGGISEITSYAGGGGGGYCGNGGSSGSKGGGGGGGYCCNGGNASNNSGGGGGGFFFDGEKGNVPSNGNTGGRGGGFFGYDGGVLIMYIKED